MWKSRVLEKLRRNEPVICAKQNITNPWITEIIGMAGFDCVWLCMEHCTGDYVGIENCIRAAKLHGMDTMVRVSKAGYSDLVRPLELDAAGVMYPHCMDAEEATRAVRMTKFHPVGRRPIDGGNIDGDFCAYSSAEYTAHANENKFLIVQVEDKEAIEHIDAIAGTEGVDAVFIGPGDMSQSLGAPGQADHPEILRAIDMLAAACDKHNNHWGIPVAPETIRGHYEKGARFLACCPDVIGLCQYYKSGLESVLDQLP